MFLGFFFVAADLLLFVGVGLHKRFVHRDVYSDLGGYKIFWILPGQARLMGYVFQRRYSATGELHPFDALIISFVLGPICLIASHLVG